MFSDMACEPCVRSVDDSKSLKASITRTLFAPQIVLNFRFCMLWLHGKAAESKHAIPTARLKDFSAVTRWFALARC